MPIRCWLHFFCPIHIGTVSAHPTHHPHPWLFSVRCSLAHRDCFAYQQQQWEVNFKVFGVENPNHSLWMYLRDAFDMPVGDHFRSSSSSVVTYEKLVPLKNCFLGFSCCGVVLAWLKIAALLALAPTAEDAKTFCLWDEPSAAFTEFVLGSALRRSSSKWGSFRRGRIWKASIYWPLPRWFDEKDPTSPEIGSRKVRCCFSSRWRIQTVWSKPLCLVHFVSHCHVFVWFRWQPAKHVEYQFWHDPLNGAAPLTLRLLFILNAISRSLSIMI